MIALIRDNRVEANHQLLQIESHDNGKSWSEPEYSNIPPDHWAAAPQLIYDEKRDLLIALTSDRYSRDHSENSIFIFSARPEEVYGQAGNWKFEHELKRPWARGTDSRPLNQSFYGYPTIAPINDHEYLVVFTERATIDGSEQADLYYFRIIFEDHRTNQQIPYFLKRCDRSALLSPLLFTSKTFGGGHRVSHFEMLYTHSYLMHHDEAFLLAGA